MAKSLNPMEAFRREQKKKELKKQRLERHKDNQTKLSAMDPQELRAELQNLERQVASNPTDGPTRKRKQELEDTLRAVVKKQKMAEKERKKQKDAPPPPPMSIAEMAQANRERFQNPENSIYYHPTLNPFGAPPPGKPQVYRNGPAGPPRGPPQGFGRGPPRQGGVEGRPQQQRYRGPPPHTRGFRGPPRVEGRGPPPPSIQQPRMMARRPGKRPPLPAGPPPPGTIQVPPRPPLPSGAIPVRPPPPPSANATSSTGMVPPPPPPPPRPMTPAAGTGGEEMETDQIEVDVEEDSVVAPYPTTHDPEFADSRTEGQQEMDEEAAERAAESRAQLRSLVPVALRVQRQVPATHSSSVSSAPPVPAPRRPVPAPPAPVPRPAGLAPPPPPRPTTSQPDNSNRSVSKEFDAFMAEVNDLL
ncbi:hypothetical protein PF005_g9605 [Phytophthora fragariae]|uniref:Wbp11/ELF5/Saf1 N-terminal domain-containing protein n=1 Tax=Phytophthora fragariae TaxID=53985 RepID=A0A6A3YA38_9STRA|nr:hypothetical protein PF003_g27622 [Phytophthora fragariae]KAE8938315.1 hypothetical protein PF009_g11809 [Phytophthora fragariae]KAE9108362.1 hypothetical protein PF010_g11933 [Phytophthora fragariae]KAE9128153.1 hypothetical protein PF007_g5364 [Phytophthora fragariae]KAE9147556.1 hypothetical protein PF006_g7770 [Phytophthora fragariae]